MRRTELATEIRKAMKRDGRTDYAFARDTGLRVSIVQRFRAGGGITLASAQKLRGVLGLRLASSRGSKHGTQAKTRKR